MKADYKEYLHDRNRLHTNADQPWPIEKAWIVAEHEAVYVQMFGERVTLGGHPGNIEYNGVIGLDCENGRAFPDFDDDPRLLMLCHKGKLSIYDFTERGATDPSGQVKVPSLASAVAYMDANGITKD